MNVVQQVIRKPIHISWMKKLTNITRLGLKQEYDQFLKSSILYFNYDLILSVFLLILAEVAIFVLDIESIGLLHVFTCTFMLLSIVGLYMNAKYRHKEAVFLISVYSIVYITLLTGYYGEASNLHYLLFVIGFSPLVHLSRNLKLALFLAIFFVIAFTILLLFNFDLFPNTQPSETTIVLIRNYSYPILLCIFVYKLLLSVFVFKGSIKELTEKGEQLKKKEATMNSVFNSTTDSVWAIDREYNCLAYNKVAAQEFERWFGLSFEVGEKVGVGIPDIIKNEIQPIIERVFQGEAITKDLELLQEGVLNTFIVSFSPIINEFEDIIGCTVYSKNITHYKQTEKALVENEQLYKTIFESSPHGLFVMDLNGDGTLDYNKQLMELLNLDKADLHSGNFASFSPQYQPDGHLSDHKFTELKQMAKRARRPFNFEWQFETDNKKIDTEITFVPIDLHHKSLCLSIIRNITKSKAMSKILQENEERYRSIFENNLLGVALTDTELQFVSANPAFCEMMGYQEMELRDTLFLDLVDLENIAKCASLLQNLIDNRQRQFNIQQAYERKDGSILYTNTNINGTYNSEGKLTSFIITIQDITSTKKTELALQQTEERYKLLFENAFQGIVLYDVEKSEILSVNQQLANTLGTTKERIMQDTLLPFFPRLQPNGETSEKMLRKNLKALKSRKRLECNWVLNKTNGEPIYGEISSFILPDTDDKCIVAILKDVTEKKKSEMVLQQNAEELNQKNQQLQDYIESNLQLENFAYMASHDLREPLRAIICFSQLLDKKYKPDLDSEGQEYVNYITTATQNMDSMICGLLDYAKINSQKDPIFERVNFEDLVRGAQATLFTPILNSRAKIETNNLPGKIYCIPSRIRQLLQNLMANAIKFQQQGNIPNILVFGEEYDNHWKIGMRDNGLGIKPDFQEKIFLLFRKLHSKHQYEGTGIGLAICKKIVEQHSGRIWVESTLGQGSTFYFTIQKTQLPDITSL